MTDLIDFICPRCDLAVHEAFYGPCAACRDELVSTLSRAAREVEVAAYEPKVNVVPNQVATKD